jgi:hypothetical protein
MLKLGLCEVKPRRGRTLPLVRVRRGVGSDCHRSGGSSNMSRSDGVVIPRVESRSSWVSWVTRRIPMLRVASIHGVACAMTIRTDLGLRGRATVVTARATGTSGTAKRSGLVFVHHNIDE